MRIALFYNTPSGGAKRAIYEWVRRLVQNHTIDVYTLSSADHDYCDLRSMVNNYLVFDFIANPLFKSPFGRINQFQRWRDLRKLTGIGQKVAAKINSGSYDVVFANTCQFTFIPAFIRFVEIPTVYYLHEPFGRKFSRQIHRPYIKENYWRQALDRIDPFIQLYQHRLESLQYSWIHSTKMLLANSNFTKDWTRRIFGVDSSICHYGVDNQSFCPIPDVEKEDMIVSVGELSPRKGFDFIIESLACIPYQNRPMLKIACNNVIPLEKEYLQALAARYQINLQIKVNQSTDELAKLYNQARICVYTPVQEPFGLVPLEAMACKTPVVGVAEGGVCESIIDGYNGLLVDRKPEKFADAVMKLLTNHEYTEKLGQQARNHVLEKWTWENSIKTLESYLSL